MSVDIWVAIITTGGAVYVGTVGYFWKKQSDAKVRQTIRQEEHDRQLEMLAAEKQRTHLAFEFCQQVKNPFIRLADWQPVADSIEILCRETEIDRVLILVAVNGVDTPNHATRIWEYRQDKREFAYVDVPLDPDYVRRLMTIRDNPILHFKSVEAGNTLVGRYYEQEGVKESIWMMLGKRPYAQTGQVAYMYTSFSTHTDEGIQQDTVRRIGVIVGSLRKIIHTAGFHPV